MSTKPIHNTLVERGNTHGEFSRNAHIAQQLKMLCRPYMDAMPATHREALHMIFSKISRLCVGDHNHLDSWHDIAGYAQLVEAYIQEQATVDWVEREV